MFFFANKSKRTNYPIDPYILRPSRTGERVSPSGEERLGTSCEDNKHRTKDKYLSFIDGGLKKKGLVRVFMLTGDGLVSFGDPGDLSMGLGWTLSKIVFDISGSP